MRGVFIHVPKTAGTTIKACFDTEVFSAGHTVLPQARRKFGRKHPTESWDSMFKFGFVRNPWDRLFSFFFFRVDKGVLRGAAPSPKLFHEFVHNTRLVIPGELFLEEDGQFALDFVGMYERLVPDLQFVARQMELKLPKMLPWEHAGTSRPGKDWRPYYDQASHDRVAELGAWEIERYGYTFEDCAC